MDTPDFSRAIVPPEKILGYLLRPDHPEGASKAKFFMARGFSTQDWEILAEALRLHAASGDSFSVVEGRFGTKLVVEAPISCPDGTSPMIRSVWMAENAGANLRLVTAHPL